MYKIINNSSITDNVYMLDVYAPLVVNNACPGHFVIVMPNSDSERIPLTIVNANKETGVLTLIYQVVGFSTSELSRCKKELFSVVGPLGKKSEFVGKDVKNKKYLLVAGGIGIAPIVPQAEYLHENGALVDIVYGAKNEDALILTDELDNICNKVIYVTDDGSFGEKGFVTDVIPKLDVTYDEAIVIGPMIMMKAVSEVTKKMNLKTTVSLNPIMVDGTGMCGACRVLVDGEVKFACVDGPEFDGHKVDFDSALKRMNIYKTEEGRAYLKESEGNTHHGGCGNCGDDHE